MHVAIINETHFVVLGGPGAASFYRALGNIQGAQKIDDDFINKLRLMETHKVGFSQAYKDDLIGGMKLQKGKFILIKDEFIANFLGEKEQRYMRIVMLLNMGIPLNQAELITIQSMNITSAGGVKRVRKL